jgi:hypothetical protein
LEKAEMVEQCGMRRCDAMCLDVRRRQQPQPQQAATSSSRQQQTANSKQAQQDAPALSVMTCVSAAAAAACASSTASPPQLKRSKRLLQALRFGSDSLNDRGQLLTLSCSLSASFRVFQPLPNNSLRET